MGFLNDFNGLLDDIKEIREELVSVKNEFVTSVQDTTSTAAAAAAEIEQVSRQRTDDIAHRGTVNTSIEKVSGNK